MTHPIEKLETIRVPLDNGFYCEVYEDAEAHEFIFTVDYNGISTYTFSVMLDSLEQAIKIAQNAQHVIQEYLVEIDK